MVAQDFSVTSKHPRFGRALTTYYTIRNPSPSWLGNRYFSRTCCQIPCLSLTQDCCIPAAVEGGLRHYRTRTPKICSRETRLTEATVRIGFLHAVVWPCGPLVTMLGSSALPSALAARLGSPKAAHPGLWRRGARRCDVLDTNGKGKACWRVMQRQPMPNLLSHLQPSLSARCCYRVLVSFNLP